MENSYEQPKLKIETIKGPEGSEVSFCPERGGVIISIKSKKGEEILYMEPDTLADKTKNVRGGIPILFPNAGPIKEGKYPLPQHGYARTSDKWEIESAENGEFSEKLSPDDDMMKLFPYDLKLRMKAVMEEDGSVSLSQEVRNEEKEKKLPVSMGLHPYFRVPNSKKKDIKFDFEGGKEVEKDFMTWSDGGTTVVDNPKLKDENAVLRVEIPDLGTLVMNVSKEYRKIWIWTLPEKDFICIEFAMREPGGLEKDPEMIKPGKTFTAGVNLKME